jgi:N-ethylmaleimide reductase
MIGKTPTVARIENRVRLLVQVMTAIAAEIGAGRTGMRLSPITPVNDAALDSDAAGAV